MDKRKEILDYNVEWLKFSETKAALLISVLGLIFTLIYSNANEVYNAAMKDNLQITLSTITAISALLSLVFCFLTINPKLNNILNKSIIYFGTIKNYSDFKELNDSIESTSDEDFNLMMSEQIYINSKIAWSKFINVSWAIRFFALMIISILFQIIQYLF